MRLIWRAVFVLGGLVALYVAATQAAQLLQALRWITAASATPAGIWVLLAASFASVVMALLGPFMAWRALQRDRAAIMLIWLAIGAILAPALVMGAGAIADRL